jgi:hypothetical protein
MEVSNFISSAFVGRIEDEQVATDALRMLRIPAGVGYESVLARLSPRGAPGERSRIREFVMRDVDGNVDRMRVDLDHLPELLEVLDTTARPRERELEAFSPEQADPDAAWRSRRPAGALTAGSGTPSAPAAGAGPAASSSADSLPAAASSESAADRAAAEDRAAAAARSAAAAGWTRTVKPVAERGTAGASRPDGDRSATDGDRTAPEGGRTAPEGAPPGDGQGVHVA